MRHVLILLVALMIGGLVATTPANKAAAGPLPAAIAADLAPAMVEKVDYWHRYYRHHGYAPGAVVVVPAPVSDAPLPPWRSPRFWCRFGPSVAANITIGTAPNASTRATTILTSDRDSDLLMMLRAVSPWERGRAAVSRDLCP